MHLLAYIILAHSVIHVGTHNIECIGAIKEARYRHTRSGKFDGIHLLGSSGHKAFTLSVLNILRAAKVTTPVLPTVKLSEQPHTAHI